MSCCAGCDGITESEREQLKPRAVGNGTQIPNGNISFGLFIFETLSMQNNLWGIYSH